MTPKLCKCEHKQCRRCERLSLDATYSSYVICCKCAELKRRKTNAPKP